MNMGVVCKTLCETACGWLGGQQRTGEMTAGFLQHPLMLHKSAGQRTQPTGYKNGFWNENVGAGITRRVLLGVTDHAALADNIDLDLTGVFDLGLDLFRQLTGYEHHALVAD